MPPNDLSQRVAGLNARYRHHSAISVLEHALRGVAGVREAEVSLEEGTATVRAREDDVVQRACFFFARNVRGHRLMVTSRGASTCHVNNTRTSDI